MIIPMTFRQFESEVEYDLIFEEGLVISGKKDKLTNIEDAEIKIMPHKLALATWQPPTIRPIIEKYVTQYGREDLSHLTAEWYKENKKCQHKSIVHSLSMK